MVRLSFSPLAAAVLAGAQIAHALFMPPPGAITVGGSKGKYPLLSVALNDTSSNVYFVYAGNYTDSVWIRRPNVTVYGQTLLARTYLGNLATISNNVPASRAGSNDASGTVRVAATNVSIYNLNIENTYGFPVQQSQAIALSVQADKFGGYGLKLSGYQDTLYANVGGEFFSNCYIEGAVDFIFGMHSSIWITESVIHSVADGFLTASGRVSDDPNWYVIDRSLVTGNGTTFLGRPWRNYARVVFQRSWLGATVNSTGWSIWNVGDERTNHTTFAEYENIGPGARGPRADFAKTLDAPVDILTVLNSTAWVDPYFL